MTAEVEIKLVRVGNTSIDSGACWNVTALPDLLFLISAEESSVVALLHSDECDTGLVPCLQGHAGFT